MSLVPITINGISIQMPSTHGWITPSSLGIGGAGNDVIPSIYKYQLNWEIMPASDFYDLYNIYFSNIGLNISVQLPKLGDALYTPKIYLCRINPVTHQGFFEGTYLAVKTELVGIDITTP